MTKQSAPSSSILPPIPDKECLQLLKEGLMCYYPDLRGGITHLQHMRQQQPVFRLPDGRLCHYVKPPKTASTAIDYAIAMAMPELWRGASLTCPLAEGQSASKKQCVSVRHHEPIIETMRKIKPINHPIPEKIILLINYDADTAKSESLHLFQPEKFLERPEAAIRFCVLREPVERFLSAWVHIGTAPQGDERKTKDDLNDPHYTVLKQYLDSLENAQRRAIPFGNLHYRPQWYDLGRNPSYYTHIFNTKQIPVLQDLLSQLLQKPVKIEQRNVTQAHGPEHVSALPPSLRSRIESLYAQDYDIWGKYF